jgi:tRNA(Ile)-lysidine synthase
MDGFEKKLISEWRRLHLPTDGRVVVAVSGGADSTALLVAIDELISRGKLSVELTAAHFNHDLRGDESEADEVFVKKLCAERGIAFESQKMSWTEKGNLEQIAREARYKFLRQVAVSTRAEFVMTAHTINDQAETFLQNLIRGSGLDGLGAMSAIRGFREGLPGAPISLARPLLNWCMREQTEIYCSAKRIDFRRDSMNEDVRFNRVRIRKILIPVLTDFNPKIVSALARTAHLIRESTSKVNQSPAIEPNPRISELRDLDDGELKTYIREWIESVRGDLRGITSAHIQAVASLVTSQRSGRLVELPRKSRVLKNRGYLTFESEIV